MAISDIISSMKENLSAAYDKLAEKGAATPEEKNLQNLATTIESITTGGGGVEIDFTANPEAYAAMRGIGANGEMDVVYLDEAATTAILEVNYDFRQLPFIQFIELQFAPKAAEIPVTTIPNNFLRYQFPTTSSWEYVSLRIPFVNGLKELTQIKSIGNYFLGRTTNGEFNSGFELLGIDGFPPNVETIGSSCLSGQSYLQTEVVLNEGLTTLGGNFLYGASQFNMPVTLPSTLSVISSYFMYNCASFNQPLTIPEGVTEIKGNAFSSLTDFNFPLTLPSTLQTINANAFQNLPSFNQPLTIPSGMQLLWTGAFINLNNFTNTLTVECPSSVVRVSDTATPPSDQFSVYGNSTAPTYTEGFTLAGPYAAEWKAALPDLNGTNSYYRKVKLAS